MSAFLCSAEHLSILANAWPIPEDKDEIFARLLSENLRSLATRYGPGDSLNDAADYRRKPGDPRDMLPSRVDLATAIVKLCDCYDYQACETADYSETAAAKVINIIRDCYLKAGGRTAGRAYDDCPWGL